MLKRQKKKNISAKLKHKIKFYVQLVHKNEPKCEVEQKNNKNLEFCVEFLYNQ